MGASWAWTVLDFEQNASTNIWRIRLPIIMDKKYLTEKEAVHRYCQSRAWFSAKRKEGAGPPYIKNQVTGRVLYHFETIEAWFREQMKEM